jgi:GTP cyclohydrolase II
MNTVESAALLSLDKIIDIRTYSGIIGILKFFNISGDYLINLVTNNPQKAKIFIENGYKINDYIPIVIKPNKYTRVHLQAKQDYLGHKGLIN